MSNFPGTFLGKVHFVPNIPKELEGLSVLSKNLWWTWNPKARELFRLIDLHTWKASRGNAVCFLRNVGQTRLDAAAANKDILKKYNDVMKSFNEYLSAEKSWWSRHHRKDEDDTLIAYFSAEFGLHESLPIYSGGLGVLSGDHLKSTSDLGIPMIAIGLLYHEGYFRQQIDAHGNQIAVYDRQHWEDLPVYPVLDKNGAEIRIHLEFPGRLVTARVCVIHVGRVGLYMLDTEIPENTAEDRKLTAVLYGGDSEMRIQQEILLGMGGVRAIQALYDAGILNRFPTLFHMNEGHSAFLSLERLRYYVQHEGLTVAEATEVIRSSSLFTTHTPVPAGHDRFALHLIEKYFRDYYEDLAISRTQFLDFGVEHMAEGQQLFSMTFLALRFAAMANGVSELHGAVSKKMMSPIWRDVPPSETPIGYITNGVHTRTWMSFDLQGLFDEKVPDWRDRLIHPEMWAEAVDALSDEELWSVISKLKLDLVEFIHDRLRAQHERFGDLPEELNKLADVFRGDALTIGFARRFATYKRAVLIFRDIDRIASILGDPERPVQMVFSGKAHPADKGGQEFIRRIIELSKDPRFINRLVFLENYDMNIGRRLTSGVDLWLNNPRRPNEASGTSGMKVPINGGLNCSILDGWWPEAYRRNPMVGWAIGFEKEYEREEVQDAEDAEMLYYILESEIVPAYYDRNRAGIPERWMDRVREAMKVVGPQFNTDRMVSEYTTKYYLQGASRHKALIAENYAEARRYSERKARLRRAWTHVRLTAELISTLPISSEMYSAPVKEEIGIRARVNLGQLTPDDVIVEIYAEELANHFTSLPRVHRFPMDLVREEEVGGHPMHVYEGRFHMDESGEHGFTVRVRPVDDDLFDPHELGLVRWAQPAAHPV